MARRARRAKRRGKLLGNALLGPGQGGRVAGPNRFVGPPYYLVNDTFTTGRAAGAVNGTDAEPGPGRRTVVDTNSKLSLSGGNAVFATGGVGNGDPSIRYAGQNRVGGRLLTAELIYDSAVGFSAGFDTDTSGGLNAANLNASSTNLRAMADGVSVVVGAIVLGATYKLCVVLRESGAYYFVKGGTFTNWTLVWINGGNITSIVYPALAANSASNNWRGTYIRVPSARWLPTPLLSDGFSAWGTSDGLGHAEGIAGGLGSGGGGLAWTQAVGSWGASGGVASASALSGGVAMALVDTGKADVIATAKVTRNAGNAGVVVRYVDANNLVGARHTGTNAQLFKIVAGVSTTVVDAAATYVAGAEIRVICEGTAFRLFYNDAAVGSVATIGDAALQAGTKQGLRTTDTANTFDNFVVRARGTGGEYAALDAF